MSKEIVKNYGKSMLILSKPSLLRNCMRSLTSQIRAVE